MVADAQRLLVRGADAEAALAVSIAAEYAWRCPFGCLASPPLEAILHSLAQRLAPASMPTQPPSDRVLHVVTKALDVGGLSGILCRWIEADRTRSHDVVLTGQHGQPLPIRLVPVITSSGGTLNDLSGMGLFDRVRMLRSLAGAHRYCVVHQDPSDVVVGLALMTEPRAWSTIVVDHADHVFWLGARMADVVAHTRGAAVAVAAAYRGLPESTAAIIPIPLDRADVEVDRAGARARLGLMPDHVLITSVGSEYKYGNATSTHFLDALEPLLTRYAGLSVMAVGPRLSGRWQAAAARFPGRVQAVGPRADIRPFLAAADIYVDSYPLPSFTSAMHAAQMGLPTICRRFPHPDLAYLELDDERVAAAVTWARGDAEVTDIVGSWVGNPSARRRCGMAAATAMRRPPHGGDWPGTLERTYRQAEARIAEVGERPGRVSNMPVLLAEAIADAHHWGGIDAAFVNVVLRRHRGFAVPVDVRGSARTLWRVRGDHATSRAWSDLVFSRVAVILGRSRRRSDTLR